MEKIKGEILKKPKLSAKARERLLIVFIAIIVIFIASLGAYTSLWLEYKKIDFMYWLFN